MTGRSVTGTSRDNASRKKGDKGASALGFVGLGALVQISCPRLSRFRVLKRAVFVGKLAPNLDRASSPDIALSCSQSEPSSEFVATLLFATIIISQHSSRSLVSTFGQHLTSCNELQNCQLPFRKNYKSLYCSAHRCVSASRQASRCLPYPQFR